MSHVQCGGWRTIVTYLTRTFPFSNLLAFAFVKKVEDLYSARNVVKGVRESKTTKGPVMIYASQVGAWRAPA